MRNKKNQGLLNRIIEILAKRIITRQGVDKGIVEAIQKYAKPLGGDMQDYDEIIHAAKDKQFVLLGEASHGTKEFYWARAEITKRLISEQSFDAVAVEADWPNAYRVNRYVSLQEGDKNANHALDDFERFPTWMWRNTEVESFVNWLHDYNFGCLPLGNDDVDTNWPVGFYGLDLYSINTSIHAVIDYLDKIDPSMAERARKRYSCLNHFMDNPHSYGYAIQAGTANSCEKDVLKQLLELLQNAHNHLKQNDFLAEDEFFCARKNAELVKSAEQYYRSLYRGQSNSWNIRDKHMFKTLEDLQIHLSDRLERNARIIVWAHNSHLGNAGATEMKKRGEFNIGQLVKSKYGEQSLSVGFSTCRGTVTAASDWGEPEEEMTINVPLSGSYEEVFHHVNHKNFLIDLRDGNDAVDCLMDPRLQRAIGVVYHRHTELQSHYDMSCLPKQFDFMIHYDETQAVKPIETIMHKHKGEMDDTYPYGL